jgi:hypothetical protein
MITNQAARSSILVCRPVPVTVMPIRIALEFGSLRHQFYKQYHYKPVFRVEELSNKQKERAFSNR